MGKFQFVCVCVCVCVQTSSLQTSSLQTWSLRVPKHKLQVCVCLRSAQTSEVCLWSAQTNLKFGNFQTSWSLKIPNFKCETSANFNFEVWKFQTSSLRSLQTSILDFSKFNANLNKNSFWNLKKISSMKIWSSSTQKCHRASAFVNGWCARSRAHANGLPALGRALPGSRRHRELWRRILAHNPSAQP